MKAFSQPLLLFLGLFTASIVLSQGGAFAQTDSNGQPRVTRFSQDRERPRLNRLRVNLNNRDGRSSDPDRSPEEEPPKESHQVPSPALILGLATLGGLLLHRKKNN